MQIEGVTSSRRLCLYFVVIARFSSFLIVEDVHTLQLKGRIVLVISFLKSFSKKDPSHVVYGTMSEGGKKDFRARPDPSSGHSLLTHNILKGTPLGISCRPHALGGGLEQTAD